jgi:hypothetical protein
MPSTRTLRTRQHSSDGYTYILPYDALANLAEFDAIEQRASDYNRASYLIDSFFSSRHLLARERD